MRKVIAAVLALTMTASLCACGGGSSASETTTAAAADTTAAPETTAAAAADTTAAAETTAAAGEASGTRAKTVTLGMNTQISTLDPYNGVSTGTIYLTEAIHDQLFSAPALGAPIESEIGKSYEISEDNKTITVEIYDYVHDQAGNEIKASDVAWSYNTYLATGNATGIAKYLENVEASDDTHVVFHLKEATCKETSAADAILTGCVIYNEAAYDADAYATNPVGCGPYKVKEFVTGASVTLERDPNYWQTDESLWASLKAQNVDTCIFKIILEDAQLALALETGDVDAVNYVSADNLQFFMDDAGNALSGYIIEPFSSILCVNVSFNMFPDAGSKVANDKNLRLAIEWAIDKEGITQTIMGRTASVSYGYATPLYGDYNPAWETQDIGFDVEKAKAYLAESDYVKNDSPTLVIMTESNEVKTKAAQMIQNYCKAIGINMEVKTADTALFDNYKYDFSEWDLKIDNNGSRQSLAAMYSTFLSHEHTSYNGVPTSFNGAPEGEMSKLCAIANNVDTNSQQTVDDVFNYYTENAIIYGLWGPINYIAAQDGITGLKVQALAYAQPWAFTYSADYKGVAD